jgi:hypothetical protein
MRTTYGNLARYANGQNILFHGYAFDDVHPDARGHVEAAAGYIVDAIRTLDGPDNPADRPAIIRDYVTRADESARDAAAVIQGAMGRRVALSESLAMARWLVEATVTAITDADGPAPVVEAEPAPAPTAEAAPVPDGPTSTGAPWGVWSDLAGGNVGGAGLYMRSEAESSRNDLIAEGEDPDDLRIIPLCAEHADQEEPADGCGYCK